MNNSGRARLIRECVLYLKDNPGRETKDRVAEVVEGRVSQDRYIPSTPARRGSMARYYDGLNETGPAIPRLINDIIKELENQRRHEAYRKMRQNDERK